MIKTLTFAAMHFSIAFGVVYVMTGSIALGGLIAFIEPLCNTVGYFFHERLWERFRARAGQTRRTPALQA
ncbi:DUF2061 domain-containing protein [Arhodomonas sp. AD133]|uniref:DUF2061 domain-containing protein n=1 Tax=Arhodomonas sp. AD133 TaxID=3415009 RepID=UPI003EBF99AD